MQRPRLPDDLARAIHQRAVREGRSGQNMLEQVVRAGLYIMQHTPAPPWAPSEPTKSAGSD
jgi:hypothetical protein